MLQKKTINGVDVWFDDANPLENERGNKSLDKFKALDAAGNPLTRTNLPDALKELLDGELSVMLGLINPNKGIVQVLDPEGRLAKAVLSNKQRSALLDELSKGSEVAVLVKSGRFYGSVDGSFIVNVSTETILDRVELAQTYGKKIGVDMLLKTTARVAVANKLGINVSDLMVQAASKAEA